MTSVSYPRTRYAINENRPSHAQMLQNLERTRAAMRSSISKASTISDEEHQLTLTEDDFLVIQ